MSEKPDAMDLARIGEVLADEFTMHPAVAAAEAGPPDLPDDHPVSWFKQHVYSSSHREDGDRLVELLDRLGFEIVRKETP